MYKFFRFLPVAIACILQVSAVFGQNGKYTYTSFTVNDGLPSNNVYQMIEDNKGFLWVATDAGVARFDGKKFQIYTTKQGLPDNDVFYLAKEKDGRIWVSGYSQAPAYFDEIQNRFVTPLDKKTLEWFSDFNTIGTNMPPLPLKNGGIFYGSKGRFLIFKNARLVKSGERTGKWYGTIIEELSDGSSLVLKGIMKNNKRQLNLYHYIGEEAIDSTSVEEGVWENVKGGYINDGKIYLWNMYNRSDECIVISNIKANPLRYRTDTIHISSPATSILFSEKSFYFTTHSGKIYVYDKQTLKLRHIFGGDYISNGYGEDSKGNHYISTVDKGMMRFRSQTLQQMETPKDFAHTNFLSIACRNDGALFAGNYYGEISEFRDGKFTLHETNNIATSKIRKILFSGNDIYTFSEQGIYRNYKERLFLSSRPRLNISFAKTAAVYNDSIILIGAHYGMLALNTHTQKMRELVPGDRKSVVRITAIAKADGPFVYFGSVNGLYKYTYDTGKYTLLTADYPLLRERVSALCYTKDGLLWVSTSSNRILVLKNDKVIYDTSLSSEEISSSIHHITAIKPGQVWISTSNGITIIQYKLNGTKLSCNTRNLTVNDGLLSNDVQELAYYNGKVYACTGNGISVIPENYTIPETEIPVYLVQIQVNQKDMVITGQYKLEYGQQDLQMQFSGVDLNGYFNHFQYALDDSEWINFKGHTLTIQLNTGKHRLKVRAVDSNGNISNRVLNLDFDVEVPFWQRAWFWIIFGILVQILLFYLINRYQKRRREAKLARKIASVQTAAIEQQAFTSLMNPHFMFNALNSIQHYINLQDRRSANRYLSDFASLIRRNFEAAQQSFIPLEEEIENIKIYLNLELMRFNDRFNFIIDIDGGLEVEDWMIPTMILQPLLENALLHGIMPSFLPGEISVHFAQEGPDLLITITDNGIGINNNLALKGYNTHKSRGMELINKRIRALSHFGTKPMTIMMEPAFDSETNPGNKVILLIPNTLYDSWRIART